MEGPKFAFGGSGRAAVRPRPPPILTYLKPEVGCVDLIGTVALLIGMAASLQQPRTCKHKQRQLARPPPPPLTPPRNVARLCHRARTAAQQRMPRRMLLRQSLLPRPTTTWIVP